MLKICEDTHMFMERRPVIHIIPCYIRMGNTITIQFFIGYNMSQVLQVMYAQETCVNVNWMHI